MYKIKINHKYDFDINRQGKTLMVSDKEIDTDIKQLDTRLYHIIHEKRSYTAEVIDFNKEEKSAEIKINNNTYTVTAKDQFDVLLDKMGLNNLNSAGVDHIKAPMPGLVLKLLAAEGADVKKGENLFILEAMKMENIIKAPADVTIRTIKIKPGDKVEKGQIMIVFN